MEILRLTILIMGKILSDCILAVFEESLEEIEKTMVCLEKGCFGFLSKPTCPLQAHQLGQVPYGTCLTEEPVSTLPRWRLSYAVLKGRTTTGFSRITLAAWGPVCVGGVGLVAVVVNLLPPHGKSISRTF